MYEYAAEDGTFYTNVVTTPSRFAVPLLPTPAPRKIGCYFSVVCLNSS